MKKIFFSLASIVFILFGCKDADNTSTTSSENSAEQTNLAANKKMYGAMEKGDSATIYSMLSADAIDHQGPDGKELKGRDNIGHMLTDMHNHVKDMKINVISSAANGDYVFTLSHMTGTTTDNTWGMPAGTALDSKAVDVVTVKDGKMVEHWGFVDANEMMKQMNDMKNMPMGNMTDTTHMKK